MVVQESSLGRGEILVSICHHPAANRLTVVILKARNLPKMDITGLAGKYMYMQRRVFLSDTACSLLLAEHRHHHNNHYAILA